MKRTVSLKGLTAVLCALACNGDSALGPEGLTGMIAYHALSGGQYQVFVMNADGSGQLQLTSDGRNWLPDWSPDGTLIAFSGNRGSGEFDIYTIRPDGTQEVRLTQGGYWDDPAWSPDASKIAVTGYAGGALRVMNADGSEMTTLVEMSAGDPAWSPDGSQIAFWSVVNGNFDVFVVNADGSGLNNLTNSPADEGGPAWSRDGSRIAYGRSGGDGDSNIFVMNADGSDQTRLTDYPRGQAAFSPCWSPDGAKIAYSLRGSIYVMNADGTGRLAVLAA